MSGWNATGGPASFTFTNPLSGPAYLSSVSGSFGSVSGTCYQAANGRTATGHGNATVTISVSGGPSQTFSGLAGNSIVTDSAGNKYPVGNRSNCTLNIGTAMTIPQGGSVSVTVRWTDVICCDAGGAVNISAGSWTLAQHQITCTLHLDGGASGHDYYPSSTAWVSPSVWSLSVPISPASDSWDDKHRFLGWFTSGGVRASGSMSVSTSGATLYAHWEKLISCSATLHGNGSGNTYDISDSQWVSLETNTIPLKIEPEEDTWGPGYTFKGWFTEIREGTKIGATVDLSDEEHQDYYAHWDADIVFDGDGSEYTCPTYKEEVTYDFTIPSWIPTRAGYDFKHWLSDVGEQVYHPGDVITIAEPLRMNAIWVKRKVKAIISDLLGIIPEKTVEGYFGDTFELEAFPLSKNGHYRFMGWDTNELLTGITKGRKGTDDIDYKNVQHIDSIWSVVDYFKYAINDWRNQASTQGSEVTYYIRPGEIFRDFVNYHEDCLHPSISLEIDNYIFIGWTYEKAEVTPLTECIMESSPFVLYAIWKHVDVDLQTQTEYTYEKTKVGQIGFTISEYDDLSIFDHIEMTIQASATNKDVEEFNQNYIYISTTNKILNDSIVSMNSDVVTFSRLRHYMKVAEDIVDDSTCVCYNNKVAEVNLPVSKNIPSYLTLITGPDFISVTLNATKMIGVGRTEVML